MNTDDRFERLLAEMLADTAPTAVPDRLIPETLRAARRVRRWSRTLALLKEPPMRISSRVAVGSPALRLAVLSASLVAMLAASGAIVAGAASLLPGPQAIDGPATPRWQPLRPTAIIDVPNTPNDTIPVATDGSTVWAAGAGQLLRIDGTTNTAQYLDAPVAAGDTWFLYADDGLWVTRPYSGSVYRLDPATGAVELDVHLAGATYPQLVGDQVWVGRADYHTDMVPIDRVTGALGASLPHGPYGAHGLGSQDSLWFVIPGATRSITRVDVATGEIVASIPLPAEPACVHDELSGAFPDAAYAGCWWGDAATDRPFARIDPVTNTIVTTVLPANHGAGPVVLDGQVWLVGSFEADDGTAFGGMVRVDPVTGTPQQWISLGDVEPDAPVAADGAIWMGDEGKQRVLRFDPASLAAQ